MNGDTIPLSEQAAHWWVVLNSETAAVADKQAFGDWVARSPERVEAYLRMVRLMRALKSDQAHWPDVSAEDLVREARAASAGVTPFDPAMVAAASARKTPPGSPSRSRFLFGLAASAVLAVAAAWIFFSGPQGYQTALGEQRSVVLDDGSLVTLNTSSRIEVDLGKDRRIIRLVSGEALFQVAHEKRRPFEVLAGDTTIRAVGTQFNVDRREARTTVTVLEGRVIVDGATKAPASYLQAAERIVVTDAGPGAPERVANVTPVTAWTQRQMIFERRPLSEVAEEFNRYNRQHILIEDSGLGRQQVTGVFQANDPASFMAFLAQIPGVKVGQDADGSHRVIRAP